MDGPRRSSDELSPSSSLRIAIPTTLDSSVSQKSIAQDSARSITGSLGTLSSTSSPSFSPNASMVFCRFELFKASNMSTYFSMASEESSFSSEPSEQSSSPSFSQCAGMTSPLSHVKVSELSASSEPSEQSTSPSFSQSAGISSPLSQTKTPPSPSPEISSIHDSTCCCTTEESSLTPLSNAGISDCPIMKAIPIGIGGASPHCTSVVALSMVRLSVPPTGGHSQSHAAPD